MTWMRNFLGLFNPVISPEHQNLPRGTVDLLQSSERDAIIARYLRKRLQQKGLEEITQRSWVNGSEPPVRPMFQLSLLKGAGIRNSWGFSLDFVPHISGWNYPDPSKRKICWHRTNSNARLDLIVEPRDQTHFSFLYGAKQLDDELESYLPDAIAQAHETWQRGKTWLGMLEIVREIRDRNTNCLGFYNYAQLQLTYALLSAKVGDTGVAEQQLIEYVERNRLGDEIREKLINHARGIAT